MHTAISRSNAVIDNFSESGKFVTPLMTLLWFL